VTDTITINEVTNTITVTTVTETIVINDPGLPEPAGAACVNFLVDGLGAGITTGQKGFVVIPFNCAIVSWTLIADAAGSMVMDIWKDTFVNSPPTVADSITGSAKPTLSSANRATSFTLTGWTTLVNAGDVLAFNIDSATGISRVTLSLSLARS